MKFKYVENDPMDQVPAPPLKMALSMLGCIAYLAAYLILWCYIFGFRF